MNLISVSQSLFCSGHYFVLLNSSAQLANDEVQLMTKETEQKEEEDSLNQYETEILQHLNLALELAFSTLN